MSSSFKLKNSAPLLGIFLMTVFFWGCSPKNTSNSGQAKSKDHGENEVKFPHELLDSIDQATVIFYNVENLFDTIDDPETKDEDFLPSSKKNWNSKRYENKLEKLSEVVTSVHSNNPLFIGLAEVENRFVVHDLLKKGRLRETKYRVAHFDSPDARGIDVALAFDHERFHMTHKQAIKLSLADDPDYKTRDILYVKGVFFDSSEVHVFVNHWSSRRGGQDASEHKRVNAAEVLSGFVDSINQVEQDANILIMGDFNDYPNNRSVAEVLDAGKPSSDSKLVNLMLPYYEKGEGTHNYKGEWGALDQIIVSRSLLDNNGLDIVNKEAKIADNEAFLYTKKDGSKTPNRTYGGNSYFGGYSDHLAIFAALKISK
tara:strand:+ start:50689 stop:51801 length:1113 start_codon:yes stop_codon:yes gene_type:complete